MSKKFLLIIATLLVIVVAVWIGVSLYSVTVDVEINPNAEQHLETIRPQFDLEIVDEVADRTKVLPVSPKVIKELEYTGSSESIVDGEAEDTADPDAE